MVLGWRHPFKTMLIIHWSDRHCVLRVAARHNNSYWISFSWHSNDHWWWWWLSASCFIRYTVVEMGTNALPVLTMESVFVMCEDRIVLSQIPSAALVSPACCPPTCTRERWDSWQTVIQPIDTDSQQTWILLWYQSCNDWHFTWQSHLKCTFYIQIFPKHLLTDGRWYENL